MIGDLTHHGAPLQLADTVEAILNPRTTPGFVARPREQAQPQALPPSFIDRCRQAFLSIQFPEENRRRVIGVTSAQRGDGRTSIAIGVATAIAADTGEATVLLECDLQQPSFQSLFKLGPGPGISDWLESSERLRIVPMAPLHNAYVVPAGEAPADPARALYQLSQSSLVEELLHGFRNVVIDLPPITSITHSSLASKLCDRLLMVARYGSTPLADLEKSLQLVGADQVSGLVLTGHAPRTPGWLRRLI